MATNPRTAAVWDTVEQAASRRVAQVGRPLRVLDLVEPAGFDLLGCWPVR